MAARSSAPAKQKRAASGAAAVKKERWGYRPSSLLWAATFFQIIGVMRLALTDAMAEHPLYLLFPVLFIALEWIYYGVCRRIGREDCTLEIAAFFLTGIGLLVLSGVTPGAVPEQIAACILGLFLFHLVRWFMSSVDRVMQWKLWIGVAAVLLLAVNLIFGKESGGSRNWIVIGPISVQPSEFVKIAFIVTGATTLDRLQTSRHITWFMLFFAACMGSLAVMRDFGTACIFFVTFIIMSFLRSGKLLTILLMCAGAVGRCSSASRTLPGVFRPGATCGNMPTPPAISRPVCSSPWPAEDCLVWGPAWDTSNGSPPPRPTSFSA